MGIIGTIGGGMAGAVVGLFIFSIAAAAGFIPLWSIIISLIVGFFLVMKGGFL